MSSAKVEHIVNFKGDLSIFMVKKVVKRTSDCGKIFNYALL